jgi:hypothetical protein
MQVIATFVQETQCTRNGSKHVLLFLTLLLMKIWNLPPGGVAYSKDGRMYV